MATKKKQPTPQQNNNDQPSGPRRWMSILFYTLAFALLGYYFFGNKENQGLSKELSYTKFTAYIEADAIDKITVYDDLSLKANVKPAKYTLVFNSQGDGEQARGQLKVQVPSVEEFSKYIEGVNSARKENGQAAIDVRYDKSHDYWYLIIVNILPFLLIVLFFVYMSRGIGSAGGGIFGVGKAKAQLFDRDKKDKVTFEDVAGLYGAKQEVQEIVEFLKNPKKYTEIGAKIPKGVLLVGMPGTGKTLLAKAIAGEAGVPYFHMSGSDFVEMFVGVGASRVRDLFEQGRKNAPCIIFIDELDAVGRTRGAGYGGGHDEREQTLNQMLVEMDGFDSKDGVIILAATNRPDVLDPALLRPGRFDRQVVVDMPDVKEREAIFRLHASKIPIDGEVDLERLARATPGSSGAEIANMVNEAALFAARKNKKKVTMEDFEEARDKVMMGVARKSKVITDDDKKATAFHEAGHALLHYYLKYSDPLHKVTIIPRGRALGMAMSLPEKDSYSRNKMWLRDRIKICLGGYIAEQMIYGWTTTGTQNDLQQAAQLARKMVCEWGMSDILGPVAFGQEDEPIFIGKEIAQHKDYSEATAQTIDNEVKHIIDECFQDAQSILQENKDKLELLAETLFERETLDDAEIRELLHLPKKEEEPANA